MGLPKNTPSEARCRCFQGSERLNRGYMVLSSQLFEANLRVEMFEELKR